MSDLSNIYRTGFFFKSKRFQQPVSNDSTSPLNLYNCKPTKRDTANTKKRNIENLFKGLRHTFYL